MKSLSPKLTILALAALVLTGFSGCNVGGSGARLSLYLTDSWNDGFDAVYITIQEIAVHAAADPEDAWTNVPMTPRTINLLDLVNGVREQLVLVDLDTGRYTQMRLILGASSVAGTNKLELAHPSYGNYVIDKVEEGETPPADLTELYHEMKVPSGLQSGIKLIHEFEINQNSTTELTLDFDAQRSVVVAGRSGNYLLKPTINVMDDELLMKITGTVTKESDLSALPDATVSLQEFDGDLAPENQIIHWRTTTTNTSGDYLFFFQLPDGGVDFNVVARKADYVTEWFSQYVENGDAPPAIDFALAEVGEEKGLIEITIEGADEETGATISFRQEISPGGPQVEVHSVNFANGSYATDPEDYQVILPVGDYIVVASSTGKSTVVIPDGVVVTDPLGVTKEAHAILHLTFTPLP